MSSAFLSNHPSCSLCCTVCAVSGGAETIMFRGRGHLGVLQYYPHSHKIIPGWFSFLVQNLDCADSFTNILNRFHFCFMLPFSDPWDVSLSSRLAAKCLQCLVWFNFPVLKEGLTIFGFLHCFVMMCSVRIDLTSQWSVQHSAPCMALMILKSQMSHLWMMIESIKYHCLIWGTSMLSCICLLPEKGVGDGQIAFPHTSSAV